MATNVVNENSTCWLTVASFDRTGAAEAPFTFTWDLHDGIDGTPLTTGNTETPSPSVTLIIAAQYNQIRHGRPFEQRIVTVTEGFGPGEQCVGEHFYLVKNLAIPTAPA